jgi:hypothetical protein
MPEPLNDNTLQQLLPQYYKRLFPYYLMCKWLGYSEGNSGSLAKLINLTASFFIE